MANKSNNKQTEKLLSDLDSCVNKLESALESFKESVDKIQEGDGKFPYWNGANACNVMKNAVTQYNNNVSLLQHIKKCQSSIKK